jgi:hypothetical protein
MIHYHGTPITPDEACGAVLLGRHAMVSFAAQQSLETVADVCQSFTLDNGAFSAWKAGRAITDWSGYYEWAIGWLSHPGCDWAIIPDVIDGTEEQNDALIMESPLDFGVPVWHLHESLERLKKLANNWQRVALGSSGAFAQIGTSFWFHRMDEAMDAVCDSGRPRCKLHGLRMLDPAIFQAFPFASADSTNIGRNIGIDSRWRGTYSPITKAGRAVAMAERIEAFNSAAEWQGTIQGRLCEGFL